MLRKRPAEAVSKQGSMPGLEPLPSPRGSQHAATSSLFPSPRLFSSKGLSDPDPAMSPTSILENKYFSSIGSFLFSDRNQKRPPAASESRHQYHPWADDGSKATGLGILDALDDDEAEKNPSNLQRRMVSFGSKLKIQVPSLCPNSMGSPAGSPIEFGIKNKDSQLALFSPARKSMGGDMAASSSPRGVFAAGSIPASEMELSEDYTCVITHGPNPRKTHIFDNCIVESFGGGFSPLRREIGSDDSNSFCSASNDFASSCYACKRELGEGTDIFIYRDTSETFYVFGIQRVMLETDSHILFHVITVALLALEISTTLLLIFFII